MTELPPVPAKEYNTLARRAHWMGACLAVFAGFIAHGWVGAIVAAILITAFAVWHECFYDPRHETPGERCDPRSVDWEDLGYYCCGEMLAFVYLILATHFTFWNPAA